MEPSRKWHIYVIFTLIFALELAVGYYLAAVYGFMSGDATSRVANAFYVLYSREPGLANIGFVWNPLMSFLEMIVLLFHPLYPLLASAGLAAVLVSGLFAALTVAHLVKAGQLFGLHTGISVAFALLYAFNPYIFYYGANGLTEAVFIYFINVTVIQILIWMRDSNQARPLVTAAVALALAFWSRYETVFFGAAIAFGVLIWIIQSSRDPLKERFREVEATWTVLLTPVVFSGLLWIFLNYSIQGDALYFLRSSYSNFGQAELLKGDEKLTTLINNPVAVFFYVIERLWYFAIPLLVITVLRVIERRIYEWDFLLLVLIAMSIPAMQYILLIRGGTAAWVRYYMYALPIVTVWIPYEISRMRFRRMGTAALLVAMIASAVAGGFLMNNHAIASDEYEAFRKLDLYEEQHAGKAAAAYINAYLPDQTILTDSFSGFIVILSSDHPKNFIITADKEYMNALENSAQSPVRIDYVMVPNPNSVDKFKLDSINVKYPRLYDEGADWAVLHKEFGGYWKIFKVIRDDAGASSPR
ncbi:MAG: hypothetical protein K0Q59_1969 [Paenibacillus sp.]|nr:hypothetical protein [Paenibacillus sp.]